MEDNYSPYCSICDGCGMEDCCSPLNCEQHPKGEYCRLYLNDLKFTYSLHYAFMEYLYKNKEKYAELSDEYDKIMNQKLKHYYAK